MAAVKRERWTSRAAFIFAAIGSAIGLGNLWRFPYLSYEYGGGAFLIAWIIGLLLLGIPWMILEFGIGHYFQRSAPGAMEGVSKKWEWLGWWAVFGAFLIDTYYTVIIAWSLRYAVSSLSVAWGIGEAGAAGAADYFYGTVLQLSEGPQALGAPIGGILIALLIVWVVLFFIMFKGAKVIGKAATWMVIIPWIFLVILLIRGVTLPGAVDGLNYYLNPDFSVLGQIDVWFAAFSQIAFTLSLGMAGMIAYGSFVARKADVNNNAFITCFSNCATSFFAGFAVFSIVGFIMAAMAIPVEEVATKSMGLAFVTFPVAISMLPAGNAFVGVIFFLCLFFLGLTSAFFLAYGGVIAPLMDKFGISRLKATLGVCIVAFIVGILYTTGGGLYWLDMVDRAVSFYGLLIVGVLSCIAVGWSFGSGRLRKDVNATSDIKVGAWWDIMIRFIVPLGLLFVVIYGGFMQDLPAAYGGYELGKLNGSHIVWIVLGVTLILSIILSAIKTKTPQGGE